MKTLSKKELDNLERQRVQMTKIKNELTSELQWLENRIKDINKKLGNDGGWRDWL